MEELEQSTNGVICQKLRRALELLRVPEKWKDAGEAIKDARRSLRPIDKVSGRPLPLCTPQRTRAWGFLDQIPPMISPGTSDYSKNLESVKWRLEAAIKAMCE